MKHILVAIGLLLSGNAFALPKNSNLTNLSGAKVEKPTGKHVVILWASWCVDCKAHLKKEIPEMEKKYKVVVVNLDASAERAARCIEAEGIKVQSFRDETKTLQKELKAFTVPHWAVYDGEKLLDHDSGFDLGRIEKGLK